MLDVFYACCLFHNLLLGRKKVDVEMFMPKISMDYIMARKMFIQGQGLSQ
jgi:hypothetical protein